MTESFMIVRPTGLGLTPDEIEAAAAAALDATQDAVDKWNSRFVDRAGVNDVQVRIRAKALGLNATDRIAPSPWVENTAFFMAMHSGE